MKNILITFIITFLLIGCKNEKVVLEEDTMVNYYQIDSTIIQDGGIKMIPIATKDTLFHVWTKRIGNNPKTKVLLLNTPSNPTGSVYSREELLALGEVLKGTDIIVFSDEMYSSKLEENIYYVGFRRCIPL